METIPAQIDIEQGKIVSEVSAARSALKMFAEKENSEGRLVDDKPIGSVVGVLEFAMQVCQLPEIKAFLMRKPPMAFKQERRLPIGGWVSGWAIMIGVNPEDDNAGDKLDFFHRYHINLGSSPSEVSDYLSGKQKERDSEYGSNPRLIIPLPNIVDNLKNNSKQKIIGEFDYELNMHLPILPLSVDGRVGYK